MMGAGGSASIGRVKTVLLVVLAGALAGACASSQSPQVARKPAAQKPVAQRCHDDEFDGPVTLAATPDTAPYDADPLKSVTCGAPPR
jgi:type IV pilus biogenesis protein CpaD/CtpE